MATRLANPFINKAASIIQNEPAKELKSEAKSLGKDIFRLEQQNKQLDSKILSTRRQLYAPSHRPFKSASPAPEQISGLKADLQQLQSEKEAIQQQLQNLKSQQSNLGSTIEQLQGLDTTIDIGSATTASAKLLSGMRSAYKFHQNPKNADKAAAIEVGTIKLNDKESVKGVNVVIGGIDTKPDSTLTIHMNECRASHIPEAKGPVSLGDMSVTIKPPLSERVTDLLSCSTVKVPSKLSALQKEALSRETMPKEGEVTDISELIKIDTSAMTSENLPATDSLPLNSPVRNFLETVLGNF